MPQGMIPDGIIEHINDAVIVVDTHQTILVWNHAAEVIYGWDKAEIIGKSLSQVVPVETYLDGSSQEAVLALFLEAGEWRGEVIQRGRAGQAIVLDSSVRLVKDGDGVVTHFIAINREITERKHIEQQLRVSEEVSRRRADRLEVLNQTSLAFAQMTTDYQSLMDAIVRNAAQIITDTCLIRMISDDGRRLEMSAFYDPNPTILTLIQEYGLAVAASVDDAPYARLLATGQPLFIPHLDMSPFRASLRPELEPFVELFEQHSMILVAMRSRGTAIGLLGFLRHGPDALPYTEDDLLLAQDLADRAALAITNARLFRSAENRLQHLQALRNIDMAITGSLDLRVTLNVFLDQVTSQLHVDAAAILIYNHASHTLTYAALRGFLSDIPRQSRYRLGEGVAGRIALERRMITIPDEHAPSSFEVPTVVRDEPFSTYYGLPLLTKGQIVGVLEVYHRTPLAPDQEWLDFLEALAGQAAIAIDNVALFENLQRSNVELTLAYDTTLEGWSRALDLRDKETEGHTQRVTDMTTRLAEAMNVTDDALIHMRRGALLHDIGKMGIPDNILLKPGPLTDDEWVIMRKHPTYAYELLSPIAFLRPALDIPYCHHEKWDGTGYPRNLKGEQIPLAARIFSVIDVWDALRSDRPYRPGWSEGDVRSYIEAGSGTHFDPQVVDTFLLLWDQTHE